MHQQRKNDPIIELVTFGLSIVVGCLVVAVVAFMAILETTRLITELTDWLRLPVLAVGRRTVKALTVPVNLRQTNLGSKDF